MPLRCYPKNDCQMYAEYPSSNFPTVGIRHRPDIAKNYPKIIYSWHSGSQYEKWTGWDKGPYLPGTRLWKTSLPVAGQMPRYRINQAKPAGFNMAKSVEFDIKEWIDWLRVNCGSGKGLAKDGKSKKDKKGKKGAKKRGKKR